MVDRISTNLITQQEEKTQAHYLKAENVLSVGLQKLLACLIFTGAMTSTSPILSVTFKKEPFTDLHLHC